VNCTGRGKSGPVTGTRRYGVPADAISVPADSASEIVKFTISIAMRRRSMLYSSSVVPPDPSVHFYHGVRGRINRCLSLMARCGKLSDTKCRTFVQH